MNLVVLESRGLYQPTSATGKYYRAIIVTDNNNNYWAAVNWGAYAPEVETDMDWLKGQRDFLAGPATFTQVRRAYDARVASKIRGGYNQRTSLQALVGRAAPAGIARVIERQLQTNTAARQAMASSASNPPAPVAVASPSVVMAVDVTQQVPEPGPKLSIGARLASTVLTSLFEGDIPTALAGKRRIAAHIKKLTAEIGDLESNMEIVDRAIRRALDSDSVQTSN